MQASVLVVRLRISPRLRGDRLLSMAAGRSVSMLRSAALVKCSWQDAVPE